MGFIPAKCTQCGAQITVDDSKDAGICEYCGTAFITEKAINNYTTYITNDYNGANINIVGGDINNYLSLAENALWANNGHESYDYANKALEIDAMSSKAWLIKMKATALIAESLSDPVQEITTYGISAISYADEKDASYVTDAVYRFYLATALSFLHKATSRINEIEEILTLKATGQYNPVKLLTDDTNFRKETDKLVHNAWRLKISVPVNEIKQNTDYRDIVKDLVNEFQYYCRSDAFRVTLYDGEVYDFVQKQRKQDLKSFKEGLTDTDNKEVEEYAKAMDLETADSASTSKKGCYIATAVYGSYDCPEVIVLRQFRDGVLTKTLFGRCFVNLYYAISPHLVKHFGKNKTLLQMGKLVLDKIVSRIKCLENKAYHTP